MGANESVCLVGPIKMSGGRGASSAVANAPVSALNMESGMFPPVHPNPLKLAGKVVKVDIDARAVDPRALTQTDEDEREHCQSCVLNLP